jgi:hypothetical protein
MGTAISWINASDNAVSSSLVTHNIRSSFAGSNRQTLALLLEENFHCNNAVIFPASS